MSETTTEPGRSRGAAEVAGAPASPPHRYDRVRRLGWWYFAEGRIREMKMFASTMAVISIGSPILYILAFGVGLAVLVDANRPGGIDGVSYLAFLAPALLLSGAMMIGAEDATFGVFGGFKWNPITVVATSAPITPGQVVVGFLVSTMAKALPGAVVFALLMALVGAMPSPFAVLVIPIAMLLVAAVACPVMAWVATQKNDRGQLSLIQRFVMVPLMLFSGTYFPLAALPVWLQWIGWISPLWHAVELGRWASYGQPLDPVLAIVHVAVLLAFAGIGLAAAIPVFRKRVLA